MMGEPCSPLLWYLAFCDVRTCMTKTFSAFYGLGMHGFLYSMDSLCTLDLTGVVAQQYHVNVLLRWAARK